MRLSDSRFVILALALATALAASAAPVRPAESGSVDTLEHPSTFSIVAFDQDTGDLGVGVQSKFLAVGAVVPWAKAGVGAIATQSFANTTYGPRGLELLGKGLVPAEVIRRLTKDDPQRSRRQLGIVDARGFMHAYTGADCQEWKGHVTGRHHACQGNILAGEGVVTGMSAAFRKTKGPLADRLLAALEAGQAKGGDKRGRQSAALLVVRKDGGYAGFNDRYIDLRVDDHPRPIEELRRVYGKWKMIFGRADGGPWQWLRMARR